MSRLSGRVALITGGTRGIGLAIAEAYLAEGASVMIAGTTERSLRSTDVTRFSSFHLATVAGNLELPETPEVLVAATVTRFGSLDVLVNNAGILGPSDLQELEIEDWDRVLNVNLRASFLASRAAAKHMRGHSGCIINVSSVAAQIGGTATSPAYVASKAGLIGLTRSLARHFAPLGIRVNCIAPADIETDMTANWPSEVRQRLIGMTPLSRFGTPSEVAGLALYLADASATFITGQTFNINGGLYMG